MEDFKEEAPDGCLYDVLGVERTSSSSEIRSAYRKLAMKWHPDKCSSSLEEQQAKDKFQGIQEAYSVLSDDKKRVLYDSGLYDGGEDEGMQSFMTEMVSMMSANTSKCSFGELKTMFDQMVDSYAFPSFSGPSSNASSDNSCSTSNVKPEETSASSEQLFGHFTSQSFCMGQDASAADNVNRQKLHKKHRRRKTPYEQGPRASTYNKVD